MKKNIHKIMSGAAGAAMLLNGCAVQMAPSLTPEAPQTADAAPAVSADGEDTAFPEAQVGEAVEYKAVPHVEGSFAFNQDEVSPADDVFNLFGTVMTGLCAKPAYALEGTSTHYVNVGGHIKKAFTVDLQKMQEEENVGEKLLVCGCASSAAVAQARVKGVPMADILEMAGNLDDVNTVTVRGADGYGLPLPLSYVLEKEAMIVYQVNGQELPTGTQLWIPETVAKYFIRNVAEIELTNEAELPEVQQREDSLRAQVSILNHADGCIFTLGEEITFTGYADDCGDAITAIEFSMDGGRTWTTCETQGATAERWVSWSFGYVPEEAGTYKLEARATTASGNVSPLAASLIFEVTEAE